MQREVSFKGFQGNLKSCATPAEAICSLVLIGWNPTKGICIDNIKPVMKKVEYAEKKLEYKI